MTALSSRPASDSQRHFVGAGLLLLGLAISGRAVTKACADQPVEGSPAPPLHYQRELMRIPMRDGVRLSAIAFTPDNHSTRYPILLQRTPYDIESSAPQAEFAKSGYIFVFESVRGRYASEGSFIEMTPQKSGSSMPSAVDESTDAYDTIDWLVAHLPNNNQRVGLRGVSYSGFYAAAGMIGAHPALKAVSPQAPQADWFVGDDLHHHGAFLLDSFFGFASTCLHHDPLSPATRCTNSGVDYGTADGFEFFLGLEPLGRIEATLFHGSVPSWTEVMQHGTYDNYWLSRNLIPHILDVHPAVLAVGGWYDANDFYGTLHVYERIVTQSPTTAATLVVGPWYHGQWHDAGASDSGAVGLSAAHYFRNDIELPFFEHYLKDRHNPHLPAAVMFETGANQWRRFHSWPPKVVPTDLYLRDRGILAFDRPERTAQAAYDEYVSNPKHPVPYTSVLTTDMDAQYMLRDQRFIRPRPDILVYQSGPLKEDMTIAGPVGVRLFVSTSGSDADYIIRLIDVFPRARPAYGASSEQTLLPSDDPDMLGFELLVRGDVMRAKFRSSLQQPEAMKSGAVTPITFAMDDVLHTFKKDHRLMVQIHSTWFPLVDLNPQKFVDIYAASESDFQTATQRVYHSVSQPSKLVLGVLPAEE